MCGICGVISFGPSAAPVEQSTLRAMADTLRHRGPDADGYFVSPDHRVGFGFRRLSIVDLATGDQPMSNEDGSVWLIFNGEIYNHADHRPWLEARGHRFRSRCDAEVVLHLYEEFGPDCIHHLRGMFAFAVWDASRRRLLLARDRVGVKPLYFAALDGLLLFGSEIKALLRHPALEPRLNEDALSLYLTFASTPAPLTLFAGVQKLPPGPRLLVDADTGQRTLERSGTQHHEVVIGERDFLDYLPDLVWHQDEPLADPVCVPLHAISEAARQSGTKVIQVGEGSDELFSGYTSYAFFSDFHRRIWRPYEALPGFLRRGVATSLGEFMSLDRADGLDRAAQGGELFW